MLFGYFEGLLNPAIVGGIIFYFTGHIMNRYKPKWPNLLYGYRTPRSLKTKETFDAANEFSSKQMRREGITSIISGIILAVFFHEKYWYIFIGAGTLILIFSTFLLIMKTEKHLKLKFPETKNH